MFIFAVHIQNFRSFSDVWCFPNPSLNCIIGPNNSGKSTLIAALSIVLDPKAPYYKEDFITQFDYYNCDTTNPITIDVWLRKQENENEEIITRAFDKFSRWKITKLENGHPEKLEAIITDPLNDIQPTATESTDELLRIQFKATWDEKTRGAEHQLLIVNEIGDPIEPFSQPLRKLIGFNAITSKREPLRDISLSKRGVFAQFLNDDEINPHFRKLIDELEENKSGLLDAPGVKQVIERLKIIVAAQVLGDSSGTNDDSVSITFLNSEVSKLRSESCFSIKVGNKQGTGAVPHNAIHVPLEYQGDGIQNLFLIISLAEMIKQRTGNYHCIFALEEPEQHLEPSQVKWVYSELCKCFGSTVDDAKQNQLFITSHSPALVGEIKGADSLIIMPVEKTQDISPRIVNANYLTGSTKKSFERNRDSYTKALLAKYILVVEGASELGLLPVAFRHLSKDVCDNPFHLGLEIVEGVGKEGAKNLGRELLPFNRPVHVLIDYDTPKGKNKKINFKQIFEIHREEFHTTYWSEYDLLPFVDGADLEIVLVKEVPADLLLEAIKEAYQDPCHDFNVDKWKSQCDKLNDPALREKLKRLFPPNEKELRFPDTLLNNTEKQAFLFTLLHEPHSCKSVKEMRIIAEYLASNNALPKSLELLRKRILNWIKKRSSILKQDYVVGTDSGN
ncbi:MAG: 15 protein [Acidobacteriota bacterium]|nr:15 protein [Acidobacteriota bacterium]